MILQTGGSALGEISTRSILASAANCNASLIETTPTCSPSAPTTRTRLAVISVFKRVASFLELIP
jgi:hypothetical protein